MSVLRLAVKRQYFDEIKAGIKTEEYRFCGEYWFQRLAGRTFDAVEITLGYPKRDDTTRRIMFPWNGYSIETITHPHFGDDPVTVYAIKLQKQVKP